MKEYQIYKVKGEIQYYSMKPDTTPVIRKLQGDGRNVFTVRDKTTRDWIIIIEE